MGRPRGQGESLVRINSPGTVAPGTPVAWARGGHSQDETPARLTGAGQERRSGGPTFAVVTALLLATTLVATYLPEPGQG